MDKITEVVKKELFKNMKYQEMINLARKEFKNCSDDETKVKFLEEAFNKRSDNNFKTISRKKSAQILVELGTYEDCQ